MPRHPDHENDTTPLGFGDAAPEKRDAPPMRVDKYDGHPDHDDEIDGMPDEPAPRPTARDTDDSDEATPAVARPKRKRKKKLDLLQRLDREPEPSWAKGPLVMLCAGLALCLIPLIVLVVKASDGGARAGVATGLFGGVLLFFGLLFQIVLMAGVMFGVGILFGIDYGPIGRGFLKLAAVIAVVDGVGGGLALAFYAGCGGFGILLALPVVILLSYALVQTQFELTGFETMVTVMGVMLATTGLSAVAAYVFLSKMAKQAAAVAQ